MDCITPGFPVLHHLLELAQTHVHWIGDAIQPSRLLLSPSSAFNLSQHQGLSNESGLTVAYGRKQVQIQCQTSLFTWGIQWHPFHSTCNRSQPPAVPLWEWSLSSPTSASSPSSKSSSITLSFMALSPVIVTEGDSPWQRPRGPYPVHLHPVPLPPSHPHPSSQPSSQADPCFTGRKLWLTGRWLVAGPHGTP